MMRSASVVAKVRALIARAIDSGASEEESRTSAVIAARLIHQHALLDVDASEPAVESPLPKTPRRVIVSKFAGYCRTCGCHYGTGARVAWGRGIGAICVPCFDHERRAAA